MWNLLPGRVLWRHFRKITRIGIALLWALFAVDRFIFPGVLPQVLQLTAKEAFVASMFTFAIERLLAVEQTLRHELNLAKSTRVRPVREDEYSFVCESLRSRASEVKRIDLLQFSGVTALPILKVAAQNCPNAKIRLLLIDAEYAEKFDEPGFHRGRIRHTLDEVKLLRESYPDFEVEVRFYKTEPGVSLVAVDDRIASVGWYRVFPKPNSPTGLSIRGHRDPVVTAENDAAQPLLRVFLEHFNVIFSAAA